MIETKLPRSTIGFCYKILSPSAKVRFELSKVSYIVLPNCPMLNDINYVLEWILRYLKDIISLGHYIVCK